MNTRDISKRLLAIHSAISIVFLLLISWSIWTGILSIYADLSRPWLRPEVAAAYDAPMPTPSQVLAFVHEGRDPGPRWNLVAPTPIRPFYIYSGPLAPGGKPTNLMVNPATGLREPWNNLLSDGLLRRLHTDLLLPKPFGRIAMGLAGALIVILVGTGLFIHGKQIKDAWRWRRNSRLLDLSESHKRVGLWVTPFLLLMALTGALLGMKIAVEPVTHFLFGKSIKAGLSANGAESTAASPLSSVLLDRCLTQFHERLPDVRFAGIERRGANLALRGIRDRSLQWAGEGGGSVKASCDIPRGRLKVVQTAPQGGAMGTIESSLRPIHYARFGGYGTLTIYVALSLLCLWIIDSGMKIVWLRTAGAGGKPSTSQRLYDANNSLYAILPLPLLYGNLLWGVTPWWTIASAVVLITALHMLGQKRFLRMPTTVCALGLAYGLLPFIRAIASSVPARQDTFSIWLMNGSLLLFGLWLVITAQREIRTGRHLASAPIVRGNK